MNAKGTGQVPALAIIKEDVLVPREALSQAVVTTGPHLGDDIVPARDPHHDVDGTLTTVGDGRGPGQNPVLRETTGEKGNEDDRGTGIGIKVVGHLHEDHPPLVHLLRNQSMLHAGLYVSVTRG